LSQEPMKCYFIESMGKRTLSVLAGAVVLAGCAALAPQFHAPPIVSASGESVARPWAQAASSPQAMLGDLDDALWTAATLQSQFTATAQSLRNSSTGLSLTTLLAAAGAAVKGVTSPSAEALSIFGVAIAGLIGANTLFVPKERARAFEEGATALGCSIHGAVELSDSNLQQAIDGFKFYNMRLSADTGQLEAWAVPAKRTKISGGPTGQCSEFQACSTPPAGISAIEAAAYRKDCADLGAQHAKRCAPATRIETTFVPDPEVTALLNQAKTLRVAIDARLSVGRVYLAKSRSKAVALELRNRMEQIAAAVGIEAAKTQPDGAAVRAAIQGSFGGVLLPGAPPAAASAASDASAPGQAKSSNAGRQQVDQEINTLVGSDRYDLLLIKRRFRVTEQAWRDVDGQIQLAGVRVAHARALARCDTRDLNAAKAASGSTGASP
jgi:hypothetical protein